MIKLKWIQKLILCSLFLPVMSCVFALKNQTEDSKVRAPSNTIDEIAILNKSVRFETCGDEQKNYLEGDLVDLVPQTYLIRHEIDWEKKLPLRCIQLAQQNYNLSFAHCVDSEDSVFDARKNLKTVKRPCLSENYTNFVYNAFHDVKDCFNLDPKRSFLQLMIESGFHINAINRSGFDAGIGQFTRNGILRVGHDDINRLQRILSESSKPSCERIASIMGKLNPDDFLKQNRCSVLALPQNPYRSLVMHYYHTLQDQVFMKDELVETRPHLATLITPEIIEQLVYLAYNRGINGTLKLLDGYLENRRVAGQALVPQDFDLWQNLSEARKIIKREPERKKLFQKKIIRKLTFAEYLVVYADKTYMAQMTEARDYVESRFGNSCF